MPDKFIVCPRMFNLMVEQGIVESLYLINVDISKEKQELVEKIAGLLDEVGKRDKFIYEELLRAKEYQDGQAEKIRSYLEGNLKYKTVLEFYAKNQGLKIDHKTNAFMSMDSDERDFHGARAREALNA